MSSSLSLGRIVGTRVAVHLSWLIVLVLLTASLATGWFPILVPGLSAPAAWAVSGLVTLLLLASVLAHELAHTFVARRRGLSVESITLFVFGGISDLEQDPTSADVEFQMALIGPATNLLIGGIAALLGFIVGTTAPLVAATFNCLAFANLVLALFNLIPGFPLDGGRLLRSLVWKKTGNIGTATYWAALVGQIAAYLFILVGIWQFFAGSLLWGIWLGFTGWFMLQADNVARTQEMVESLFGKLPVGEVMRPVSLNVPPDVSLQELVDVYLLPHGLRAVPVVEDEQLLGLIALSSIRPIPREQWSNTLVRQAMLPLAQLHVASPEQSLNEALSVMVRHDINQIPVVRGNHIVGMVSRENILHLLASQRTAGMVSAHPSIAAPVPTTNEPDPQRSNGNVAPVHRQ